MVFALSVQVSRARVGCAPVPTGSPNPYLHHRGGTVSVTALIEPPNSGEPLSATSPDPEVLKRCVVNLGNNGMLSDAGAFRSSPQQIDGLFQAMGAQHRAWRAEDPHVPLRVLLYAHGGLNSEAQGLKVAAANFAWWIAHRVYPLFFCWESGWDEALEDIVNDELHRVDGRAALTPALATTRAFNLEDILDLTVEAAAHNDLGRVAWDEMKENALAASQSIDDTSCVTWNSPTALQVRAMMKMPGASLTALRLRQYIADAGEAVGVHLIGHSAGAIFHQGLLPQLGELQILVTSVQFLAAALRDDEFVKHVLPLLGERPGPGGVQLPLFASFGLSDQREKDDNCISVYHKSLLYLISQGLERGEHDVPLLGMAKFLDRRMADFFEPAPASPALQATLRQGIESRGGHCVIAPALPPGFPPDGCCNATTHGGFAGETHTIASVTHRIVNAPA
jgi:hypothetical protein